MPRYAWFDHTVADPSPVMGWYDTDALTYPSLPPAADLLAMTNDQWAARLHGHWAIVGGVLTAVAPFDWP